MGRRLFKYPLSSFTFFITPSLHPFRCKWALVLCLKSGIWLCCCACKWTKRSTGTWSGRSLVLNIISKFSPYANHWWFHWIWRVDSHLRKARQKTCLVSGSDWCTKVLPPSNFRSMWWHHFTLPLFCSSVSWRGTQRKDPIQVFQWKIQTVTSFCVIRGSSFIRHFTVATICSLDHDPQSSLANFGGIAGKTSPADNRNTSLHKNLFVKLCLPCREAVTLIKHFTV